MRSLAQMPVKQRKRILLIVRYPVGGIRTYFKDMYRHPLFDGYRFTIVTPEQSVSDLDENIFTERKVEYLAFKDNRDLIRCVWKALSGRRYDLVHSHGFTAGLLAVLPVYIRRVPHLLTAHDVFQYSQFRGFSGYLKRWMVGKSLGLISCTMAVSNEAAENITDFFPFLRKKEKLVAIQNGIATEKFCIGESRNLHLELELDGDCILFGFFGRFMKQKGFRYLVEAAYEIKTGKPELNYRIITFGWGGFIREEQEYIRSKGLDDVFLFMPHTDDMPAAIRGVNVVIMPSLWEACPLLPMESMVSGVPLIASNCIGLNEVTIDTPALSFTSGSVSEVKAAMIEYINNTSKYDQSAHDFKHLAVERYDVVHSANQLCELYSSMIH